MNIFRKPRHILFTGRSGTGKTTAALRYIQSSHHKRILIYDHAGEFSARLGIPPVIETENLSAAMGKRPIVCFDPSEEYAGSFEEGFSDLCDWFLSIGKETFAPLNQDILFVCDEVQKFVTPYNLPFAFKELLETGRKYHVDTLSLSQRPNAIHPAMREQLTEITFFRLTEPNSQKFGEHFGVYGDVLENLETGEFVYLNMNDGAQREGTLNFG